MSNHNPLTSQCVATSRRSGRRCKAWVVGGGVCRAHGQSRKVKAAQEARAAVMKSELEAQQRGVPFQRRHPGEVLADAVAGSDVLMRYLLVKHAEGALTPEESTALGIALDRAGRLAKTALDANVMERLTASRERISRQQAEQLIAVIEAIFADPRVLLEPDALPGEIVVDAMAKVDAAAVAA